MKSYPSHELPPRQARLALFCIACLTVVTTLAVLGWRIISSGRTSDSGGHAGNHSAVNRVEPTDPSLGDNVRPKLLSAVAPHFPVAREIPVEAMLVSVLVNESGEVIGAKIDQAGPGQTEFEDAAIATALSARFAPGRRGGQPVTSWTNMVVRFGHRSNELALYEWKR